VLVVQLVSLQHVAWPARNRTLNRRVAARVLATHRELAELIAARDAAAARCLMDEHLTMIRARRVAERGHEAETHRACC
jgi:GntR family transcriptional repressor for pyruvate dehydrogenase complex